MRQMERNPKETWDIPHGMKGRGVEEDQERMPRLSHEKELVFARHVRMEGKPMAL